MAKSSSAKKANKSTTTGKTSKARAASTTRATGDQPTRARDRERDDERITPRDSEALAHEAATAQRAADPELRGMPDEGVDRLDDPRDETDDVAAVRAAMGAPDGAVDARATSLDGSPDLAGGDLDADARETGSGEEAVGGSTPTPDQDNVDEIGEALGVTYQPDEPIHTTEKIERRDDDRWELNPASSEDFAERRNLEHAVPERAARRGR